MGANRAEVISFAVSRGIPVADASAILTKNSGVPSLASVVAVCLADGEKAAELPGLRSLFERVAVECPNRRKPGKFYFADRFEAGEQLDHARISFGLSFPDFYGLVGMPSRTQLLRIIRGDFKSVRRSTVSAILHSLSVHSGYAVTVETLGWREVGGLADGS